MVSFDHIAELMGVSSSSFVNTHSEKVTDLMVKLVEYVQAMDKILNPPNFSVGTGTGPVADTGADNLPRNFIVQKSIVLEKNVNGFPVLPDPIPSDGWKKTTWDSLFTDYLGQQYHLACGGIKKHIPYKQISEKQQDFVDKKYLPRKTVFRPPRNIPLDKMKIIFDHFLQSQRSNGPENTFKFKSIKLKGNTVPANYRSILNDGNASETRPISSPVSTTPPKPSRDPDSLRSGPNPVAVQSGPGPVAAGPDTNPSVPVSSDPTAYPTPPPATNPKKTRPKPRPINKKKN